MTVEAQNARLSLADSLFSGLTVAEAETPNFTPILQRLHEEGLKNPDDYSKYLTIPVHARIAFVAQKLEETRHGPNAILDEAETNGFWLEAAGMQKTLLLSIIKTYTHFTETHPINNEFMLEQLDAEGMDAFCQKHVRIGNGIVEAANYVG